jgi:Asp-tRNA(Asn)/Glu-tRNA(Gln) amidotransferase A subunit family amidase
VDPAVEAAVRAAAAELQKAGAVVDEVAIRMSPKDDAVWIDLWGVFMAGYFGHLVEQYRERMDPEVLSLIERGSKLSAVHMKQLEIARTDLWRRLVPVLADHDAILCPTMAQGPPPAAKADRPPPPPEDGRFHTYDMTGVFNLVAPCPALSVPCGWDPDGLPIGLQIVGRRWREDTVLRIGRAVEAALPQAHRPPL